MALTDIAGVLSRYFVIGFFLPAFFGLVAVATFTTQSALPKSFSDLGDGTQVAVLGGVALLLALLLSGVHYNVLRLIEGYPLDRRRASKFVGKLHTLMIQRADAQFGRLASDMQKPRGDPARRRAAQRLARYYPPRRNDLLPTRFGNAIRSFERHPRSRWGLDGVAVWPHIELLLTQAQKDLHASVQTDVAFFVNAVVLALASAVVFAVDLLLHTSVEAYKVVLLGVPILIAWLMYRAAIEAAVRWGEVVRATFDVYRLPLYQRLGVNVATDPDVERVVAEFVNRCIWFGEPLPWMIRSPEIPGEPAPEIGGDLGE